MTVLGINGGFRPGYQDVSACIIRDGEVLAAVEEERLNRIKFSPGRLPYLSVIEVLKISNISIRQVDVLAFHGSTWENEIEQRICDYFIYHFGYCPPLKRFHHHDCHAAGTFFSSGFDEALILTMDNSGDGISAQVSVGRGNKISVLERFPRPHSFGVFYSLITQFCGFVKDSDEYKLMGLSAYGNKSRFNFSWLLDFENGELKLNTKYIHTIRPKAPQLHRDEMNFNEAFLRKMKAKRRLPGEPLSGYYKDVAASAQSHLESLVLKMLVYYCAQTGIGKICLAGGVALNCLMNQKIMNADFCEALFIQPASSDAGISIGAAWLAGLRKNVAPIAPANAFLGSEFSNTEIRQTLENCHLNFERCKPAKKAAELLSEGKVIGWFQGRMEFGPRALGNRSILANPAVKDIQKIVNQKIKFRDSFRPFGAAVIQGDSPGYFEGKFPISPYMTVTYNTEAEFRNKLAGVTHMDGTCRIQTVNGKQNPLFFSLLKELKKKTGLGVCLNTSFNLNYEPIVSSPQQAIATFYASGLDALIIGSYLVMKDS